MKLVPPYALIDLASEELPILGSDGQRLFEYRIPSVLTREACVYKFHRGCPSKSLLPIFYACLEAIAKPLIPGSPSGRKHGVFPCRDSAMVELVVECARLAGELVHGEPSRRLIFPGKHYGDALAAVMEQAKRGRPIVLDGFDLVSVLRELNKLEASMKKKDLPFSVAADLYRCEDPPEMAFVYHLMQIIEIADGDRDELTLQTKRGEIALKREEVQPGFYVAAAFTS